MTTAQSPHMIPRQERRPLTAMQEAFVHYLVCDGLSQINAARRAGYRNAKDAAYTLMRVPHVQDAIRQAQFRFVESEVGNLAITALKAVLENKDLLKTAAGCRVLMEAAKVGLDRAGLAAPAAAAQAQPRDPWKDYLESLTDEEVAALARKGERALAIMQSGGDALPAAAEPLRIERRTVAADVA